MRFRSSAISVEGENVDVTRRLLPRPAARFSRDLQEQPSERSAFPSHPDEGGHWTGHPAAATLTRTMVSEVDALRAANILLDKHGAQEAWHILMARAVKEHDTGQVEARGITLQVLAAVEKLTATAGGKPLH